MTELTPYMENYANAYFRLWESMTKIDQAHRHLAKKINNRLYSSLTEKYKVTIDEVACILSYCDEQIKYLNIRVRQLYDNGYHPSVLPTPGQDKATALISQKEDLKGDALMLAKDMKRVAEALAYADDILESLKSRYIEKRKEASLRRKGINPMLYEIEASYRSLSKLEDCLDVVSISVCDALDGSPDSGIFMDLLMQATDLGNRISQSRFQISKVMEKMISKTGDMKSDLSAHDLKLIFDLKRDKRELEKAVSRFSIEATKTINARTTV